MFLLIVHQVNQILARFLPKSVPGTIKLSHESKVSCSRKQQEPLMGLELTTERHPPITSQRRYPKRHTAPKTRLVLWYCIIHTLFINNVKKSTKDKYLLVFFKAYLPSLSQSTTLAPSLLMRSHTDDFPLAIPPVRPIIYGVSGRLGFSCNVRTTTLLGVHWNKILISQTQNKINKTTKRIPHVPL